MGQGSICVSSKEPGGRVRGGAGSRAHSADTEQLVWQSGTHPHAWAIRGVTRPRAARLGPGPRLVAVTTAAAEAAAVMAWERGGT